MKAYISFGITWRGPFIRPGPGWTVTGYRTLAKEEVPRKRSLGMSYSKRTRYELYYSRRVISRHPSSYLMK